MFEVSDSERLLAEAAGVITRRDAEILLAHAWNLTRSQLIARDGEPVPADVIARFTDACARRARGVPVAYLLGRREFWSLDFEVTSAVLVPRPETELLVQRALELVGAGAARVVDLGTGSGAIAIALAHERPYWKLTATDTSADALAVARRNGERLTPGRLEWLVGDWFAPLAGRRFDCLVSNPPYIAADDPVLRGDGLEHEPRGALTPGGDGTAALATLINEAPDHLAAGGWLALEHGNSQGEWTRSALVARGFTHVTSAPDLAGHERVTCGQWSNQTVSVVFETSLGNFEVELFEKEAPLSAANFQEYVDDGFFDGVVFHRVIPGFMIQGGGFEPGMKQKKVKAPIKNEAANGLKNSRGTLAMARTNDINSATAQFFVNLVDNEFLDHAGPSNYGYAVFGKVSAGMDVIDEIAKVATTTRSGHQNVPAADVVITKASKK